MNKMGGNPVKLHKVLVMAALAVALLLTGCNSLDDAIVQAKKVVPGDWQVVHTQQVQTEASIVFYINNSELGAGLFKKDGFGWKWLGSGIGSLVTYPEGLSWRYAELGDKSTKVYLYYGLISNPGIEKVEVRTTWKEVSQAQIIQYEDDRIWYALISKSQVPSTDATITGYDGKGKILYLFEQPK